MRHGFVVEAHDLAAPLPMRMIKEADGITDDDFMTAKAPLWIVPDADIDGIQLLLFGVFVQVGVSDESIFPGSVHNLRRHEHSIPWRYSEYVAPLNPYTSSSFPRFSFPA